MKYIYLDQNKWILLARGWYSGNGEIYELVVKIKGKIKNGELRFVLSLSNVRETLKQHDKARRESLIDFMIDLSEGYTISPYVNEIKDTEINNALARRLGLNVIDLQDIIFSKGLPGLFGRIAVIKEDVPEEVKKEMIAKVNSIESMRKLLRSEGLHIDFYQGTKEDLELLKKFEDVRYNERNNTDKELTKKVVLAKFMSDFMIDPIINFSINNGISKEESLKLIGEKEDLIKLFQDMPALYSFYCLIDRRDRDLNKKLENNDLNDIFSFCMAIPYCDVVFGEKRFVALANQSKLGRLYDTVVTSSLQEFMKEIF